MLNIVLSRRVICLFLLSRFHPVLLCISLSILPNLPSRNKGYINFDFFFVTQIIKLFSVSPEQNIHQPPPSNSSNPTAPPPNSLSRLANPNTAKPSIIPSLPKHLTHRHNTLSKGTTVAQPWTAPDQISRYGSTHSKTDRLFLSRPGCCELLGWRRIRT